MTTTNITTATGTGGQVMPDCRDLGVADGGIQARVLICGQQQLAF